MAIRRQATAGMVADTSLYNIDGACTLVGPLTANKSVGRFLGVTSSDPSSGNKVLGEPATGQMVGVVVRSSYETELGVANGLSPVNFLTHGRIWVETNLASNGFTFGGNVAINANGQVVAKAEGTTLDVSNASFAGGYQASYSVSGVVVEPALVEIQLTQGAVATTSAS